MKILFWNLNRKSNEKWVSDIILENDVDIAIFAEYQNTSFNTVISNLKDEYKHHIGYNYCKKITLVCKKQIGVVTKREQGRYILYTCFVNQHYYNIIGIHLPSPPHSDSSSRKLVIRDIIHYINELENEEKNINTIVIGDFNCNPFDEEIIEKDSFNAVLFKSLMQQEIITYGNKKWRRFYNPILHFISEDTMTYGSIYYSSSIKTLYWNSFDQILVRKGLVNNISSLQYLRTIKKKSLLKKVMPNDAISDHLPLLVDFREGTQL